MDWKQANVSITCTKIASQFVFQISSHISSANPRERPPLGNAALRDKHTPRLDQSTPRPRAIGPIRIQMRQFGSTVSCGENEVHHRSRECFAIFPGTVRADQDVVLREEPVQRPAARRGDRLRGAGRIVRLRHEFRAVHGQCGPHVALAGARPTRAEEAALRRG